MINKKAQVSRTVILFSIIVFYTAVGFFYSLYGASIQAYQGEPETGNGGTIMTANGNVTSWNTDTESKSGIKSIAKNVVVGFKEAPDWLNILLLGLLVVFVGYLIVASFVPTVNAGG